MRDARTLQDAYSALDQYQTNLNMAGASLCGGRSELFDRYLQIYQDHKAGVESDQLLRTYGEPVLKELSERGLITLKTVVDL